MTPTPFCCDITSGSEQERNEFKRLFGIATPNDYWNFDDVYYGYSKDNFFECCDNSIEAMEYFTTIIPLSEGITILKEMVGEDAKEQLIEITFGNHLKCLVKIANNTIEVKEAMNGWGDNVPQDEIKIQPKP